jgi:hypothetical protein
MKGHKRIFGQFKAQSMVEFALVFPLLLFITYGLIEFGRMLAIYILVTSAAREGARYGAAAGDVGELTPHYQDCDGIVNRAVGAGVLIDIAPEDVSIQFDHGPNDFNPPGSLFDPPFIGCPAVDPNDPSNPRDDVDLIRLGDRIVVQVTAHFAPMIAFVGWNGFDINTYNARTILRNIEVIGDPPPPGCIPVTSVTILTQRCTAASAKRSLSALASLLTPPAITFDWSFGASGNR